ncbi:MAG TPA: response regulator [Mycobacteriales bacterium]|nr:response regulator [Mycobacteriales bacterium]
MAGCRTLVIDDDPDMAFLAAETIRLANHGLTVIGVVHSGADAMEFVKDADVVVLDFRMPDRDGLAVAADIFAVAPDMNIVLYSAYLDVDTVGAATRIGIRECVSKADVHDLPAVVRRNCPAA